TARLKLAAAGLPTERLLASSDDSPDRRAIFDRARHRTKEREGRTPSDIVLVGDGVWDVRTAAQLGRRFVGIGVVARAETLRNAGADVVIADDRDREAALDALKRATMPSAGLTLLPPA
ncbi:MAG: hypothetical protein WED32_01710, partial [Patescibacteria group bacterium]